MFKLRLKLCWLGVGGEWGAGLGFVSLLCCFVLFCFVLVCFPSPFLS